MFVLVRFLRAEKFVESVELEVPGRGTAGQPGLRLLEGSGARADQVDTAGAAACDEAGAFEDTQVAGNGGRRDAKGFGEQSYGNFAALAEADEDGAAGRVGSARAEKMALTAFGWLTIV
jgi:hypothetical protein